MSYLQSHNNVGGIDIGKDAIYFKKAIFFTTGKILYAPYNLVCRNGGIYYDGDRIYDFPKNDLSILILNCLINLRPGLLATL